ncbi:uncharacterized protein CEXT_783551 [Caerostris extrusa]|uniref:Uncharacterized protein n=1 Tax=Caerostris extrusa TaxID=172846 RepID=A0AAV4MTH1_CAEEX|nr:uncharacterized protein CEXT_783551 [Caerostris extrusa]
MEEIGEDDFDSCESDFFSDNEIKNPAEDLRFFSKITEELRAHFKRNSGKEDYCDDIYEDIYATPVSGSYSYWEDLIAEAQQRNRTSSMPQKTSKAKVFQTAPIPLSEFHCSCACSGHFNPTMDAGPLEELFKVLEPVHQDPSLQVSPATTAAPSLDPNPYWPENFELYAAPSHEMFCNPSLDDGYSDFSDIFHRWSTDGTSY